MTTPVTLVTGFLGAGKTTFINRLLIDSDGVTIAAIVNDFGSINIDADLIAESGQGVIGLKNGCICCSLQGDLLRTLKRVLAGAPDHILIEASGVADPQGIVEVLMDPVVREAVRLDAIVAVVDAEAVADNPRLTADPLWRGQTEAADFIALSKTTGQDLGPLTARFTTQGKALVFDSAEPAALDVLVRAEADRPALPRRPRFTDDRFVAVEWEWEGAVSPNRFQASIEALAPSLVRAKGIVNFEGRDGSFSFNLVGRRATMEPLTRRYNGCRLVLIGERGRLDAGAARQTLFAAFADMSVVGRHG